MEAMLSWISLSSELQDFHQRQLSSVTWNCIIVLNSFFPPDLNSIQHVSKSYIFFSKNPQGQIFPL